MQLYVRDWLASTYGMPLELKGFHIDLLCIAWDNGPLPDDSKWRQRVAGVSATKTAALWAMLQNRWRKTRKGWINPRQERQRRALAEYRAHAEHAASMRWASIGHAVGHQSGMHPASSPRMPKRSIASASASSDQDQDQLAPLAPRERSEQDRPRVLEKIAHTVLDDMDARALDPLDVPEELKRRAAKAQLRYDGDRVRKALDVATVQRARRARS